MVEDDKNRGGGGGGGVTDGCPICLEPISGEAFLDQCFHRFCYHCILQWSEMLISKPQSTSNRLQCLKCPLCKSHYASIVHDLSGAKFRRHYILTPQGTRYQRLDGHLQREAVYASEVERKLSRFTNVVPNPNRWLSVWVQRELQALMQDVVIRTDAANRDTLYWEEDVETVMQHVVGVVEAFNKRVGVKASVSAKGGIIAKDLDWHATIAAAVQPFIFEHAEKFAEELGSFLFSGLDIAAYDQQSQLRASVAGQLGLNKDANPQDLLKGIPRNTTFDLYDEDVDDDGVDVMVGRSFEGESRPSLPSEQTTDSPVIVRRSTEAECPSRGETSEEMEHHPLEENTHAQSHRYSRREAGVEEKDKKRHIKPADYSSEGEESTSGHGKEVRKNRKRSRSSPSLNTGHS